MAIPQTVAESVAAPVSYDPTEAYERLSDAIDTEAESFPEPARFRAAVFRVLEHADNQNVDAVAAQFAWKRFRRVLEALRHFSRPLVTIDALQCLGHLNDEDGTFMADYAKRHRMTRVSFFRRVERLGKYLGTPYQRRKIKGRNRCKPQLRAA